MTNEKDSEDTVETTDNWEDFVKSEVAAVVENFVVISNDGRIGIKYVNSVKENTESGPVFDSTKAKGVEITVCFDFKEDVDI